MSEYCVVVAGGGKARIFTLEPVEHPELQSGPNLVEKILLESPERSANDDQAPAVPRTGHDDDRKFARDIATTMDRMIQRNGFRQVVVCADSRMLGLLRPNLDAAVKSQVELREVRKDLAKFSSREIHKRLAGEGHLPEWRRRAAG